MDKHHFIDTLIEEVRDISVEIIVSLRVRLTRSGRNYLGLCPFHSDKNEGSFVVSPDKGIWKCFSCGDDYAGVGGISFIMLMDKIDFLEAVFKIALELGKITLSDYEEYYGKRRFKESDIKKYETKYATNKGKMIVTNDIASDEILDKVYSIFVGCCSLSEEHYKHLSGVRQLREEKIKEDYFTFPSRRIFKQFIQKLRDSGYTEEVLKKVPGFYYDKKYSSWTFAAYKGIGMLTKNAFGQIIAIQIRRDDVKGAKRYVWFSSSFALKDDRYEYGVGPGSPCDVGFPKVIKNPVIAITEGKFKEEKLTENNLICISVQGVGNWKGILKQIRIIQQMDAYKQAVKGFEAYAASKKIESKLPIYVCFDADMIPNYQVYEQARKMTDSLQQELKDYQIIYINWLEEYGKGIDDLIINNNMGKIRKYSKKNLDKTHSRIIDIIKVKEVDTKNYESIQKIPKDVMREYFFKHMNETLIAVN